MATSSQPGIGTTHTPRTGALWTTEGLQAPRQTFALLAASVISADLLRLEHDLRLLEEGGIDLLHFDVMDGCFVPRLGLPPELVAGARRLTQAPIDVHLMVSDPGRYVPLFAQAGADIIVVHAEATHELPRVLALIRDWGVHPGVALSPATSPQALRYVLDDLDLVLVMAINPGSIGERARPNTLRKLEDLRAQLGEGARRIHIMIDGNVGLDNAPEMIRAGATVLVCGSSSIFGQGANVREGLLAFRGGLREALAAGPLARGAGAA